MTRGRRRTAVWIHCAHCDQPIERQPNQLKRSPYHFCSHQCRGHFYHGPISPLWRGGRVPAANGYIRLKVGRDHPMADAEGYALEHRIVMAAYLGRSLSSQEVVHHRNHIRYDNRIENLSLLPSHVEHRALHAKDKPPQICWCGEKHEARGLCLYHYNQSRKEQKNAWRRAHRLTRRSL